VKQWFKECPKCHSPVLKDLDECNICGYKFIRNFAMKKILILVMLIVVSIATFGFLPSGIITGFGWGVQANNTSTTTYTVRCTGTNDSTTIQTAVDAAAAAGGGIVQLTSGTYNFGTTSLNMNQKNGVVLKGVPVAFKTTGIADLTAVIEGGTIITYTGKYAAITGNNIYGGGIEDIAFSDCNGLSLGKQNQFGPQFYRIKNVKVFEPKRCGIELYNFGQVLLEQPSVFRRTAPDANWTGIRFVSENNGQADSPIFTVNATTDLCTLTTETSLGLIDGDIIYLYNTGGVLPTVSGSVLSAATPYYLRDVSTNTFKIARTITGDAIDFTGTGSGTTRAMGCSTSDWQPGNSVIINPYILYNVSESIARVVRGIHAQVVNPVYGGVTHNGMKMNYLQMIRPQINNFGFSGTKAGSNRVNIMLEGVDSTRSVYGFELTGIDCEGAAQNAVRVLFGQDMYLGFAGLSSNTAFYSGLYMANCTNNTIKGTSNLTFEAGDSASASTCSTSGIIRTYVGTYAPVGIYYDITLGATRVQVGSAAGAVNITKGAGYNIVMNTTRFVTASTSYNSSSGNKTLDDTLNSMIKVTTGTAALTYTLSGITGSDEGMFFIIQKVDSGVGSITLTSTSSGDIVLDTQWDVVKVEFDGHQWNVVWSKIAA